MKRPLLIVPLLAAAALLQAQLSAPQLEEAADFARGAARAALQGQQRIFVEALDTDTILRSRLGAAAWTELIQRQRDQLQSSVAGYFFQSLAAAHPPRSGQIAWSWALPVADEGADVMLGLKFGDKTLKTRWSVRRSASGWRVVDISLSDPGISLADMSVRALGPEPIRRRARRPEALHAAYPRLAVLAVISLLIVAVAPRLSREKRLLLLLTAAAPAILIAIDGVLAVRRTLSEAYALAPASSFAPWREAEQRALQTEREGRGAEARSYWSSAIAQGERAGPVDYQMGLQARQRGEADLARSDFERALGERPPAPGASKELAAMDLGEGNDAQAEQEMETYLKLSGPDPDSLSMLAVIRTNLGKSSQAVEAIREARSLVGESWRGAELEAQVRARAGDAAGAVAALRPLEGQGRLDRSALRSDPAYLTIASDPAWVSFINEKPSPPSQRVTTTPRP